MVEIREKIWIIFWMMIFGVNCESLNCSSFVPASYDNTIPPTPMTKVDFEYQITNFDNIDVDDYSMTIRMRIVLTWLDERVMDAKIFDQLPVVKVSGVHQKCFWTPEIHASELKSMKTFDEELIKPQLFVLASGMTVSTKEYMFTIACSMDMTLYPSDAQSCNLTFSSFLMSNFKLEFASNYRQLNRDATSDITYLLVRSKEIDARPDDDESQYLSSKLILNFIFKRRLPLYMMITYLPSFLVTIVSFISFWIKPDAVPGRVTLGVTCLLALMTQMVSVRSHIFNVNYVTAIDAWFLACITFVALSLIEFAISYTLNGNQKVQYLRVNKKNVSKMLKIKWKLFKISADQYSRIIFPVAYVLYVMSYGLVLGSMAENRLDQLLN